MMDTELQNKIKLYFDIAVTLMEELETLIDLIGLRLNANPNFEREILELRCRANRLVEKLQDLRYLEDEIQVHGYNDPIKEQTLQAIHDVYARIVGEDL